MAAMLLISGHTGAWRQWHRANLAGRDFICLDPADAEHGFPCRAALYREGKPVAWRFIGSLSAARSPHVLVAALAELMSLAQDPVVELFPMRTSPLVLQTARLCASVVHAEATFMDRRLGLDPRGWAGELSEADLPDPSPASVLAGQRKARWLQMLEDCEAHEVDLRKVPVEGLRLGSGTPIPIENLKKWGFADPLHGESSGQSLLIVSDAEVDDLEVTRALDAVHASKAAVVTPRVYVNLLCAFSRADGEDFGMGRIERIDFREQVAHVRCTAVAPATVHLLRVGGLKVNEEGRELGELKAWEA